MGLRILDVSSFVPENEVYNSYFENYLDTSDQWIQQRTGIVKRYFSEKPLSEMIKIAVAKLPFNDRLREKTDLILTATISSDKIMPSMSAMVHKDLRLREEVFSADLNMACTGFVGALIMAESMLEVGKCAICIGAEKLSSITNFEDRSTAMLFGDGVGIALVIKTEEPIIKIAGTKMSEALFLKSQARGKVEMEGKEVYKFATSTCLKAIKSLLQSGQDSIETLRWIVLHQANARIIESVSKKMGSKEKFYQNIENYGNTSSASIGLCLNEIKEKKQIDVGDRLALLAFGGGFTYGGIIVEWGEI